MRHRVDPRHHALSIILPGLSLESFLELIAQARTERKSEGEGEGEREGGREGGREEEKQMEEISFWLIAPEQCHLDLLQGP